MAGPVRNIAVTISANVRRYTDGLRTAETATRRFQKTVQTTGSVSQSAGRQHSQYERALHGVGRGSGRAMTEVNNLSAATRRGQRAMRDAQNATSGFGQAVTFLKSAAIQSVAALGGFALINATIGSVRRSFTFLTDSVLDFDDAMTQSLAIASNATEATRNQMEAQARLLATQSKYNPAEVAEGYYYLIAAGLDVAQTQQAIGTATRFAQAGMMDLEKASEALVQSQAALGLVSKDPVENMQQMTRVADVFAKAADISTTTIELMSDAFTNKFGTALNLAGRELEEGAALMMAYAKVGVQGRLAGTQGAIALRDLQKAAINNGQAMKQMGIEVFDANGNMNNIVEIAKDMNREFGNMSDKDLRVTLKSLGFADRAVHAILPVIATGAKEWDNFYKAANSANGYSARVAEKQMESLRGGVSRITGALAGAAQQVGVGILDKAFQLWDAIEEPISKVGRSLADLGKSSVGPALMDTGKMVGSVVVPALLGMLRAVQGVASVFQGLGAIIRPVIQILVATKGIQLGWAALLGLWKTATTAIAAMRTAVQVQAVSHIASNMAITASERAKFEAIMGGANALGIQSAAATSSAATQVGANTTVISSVRAKIAALNLSAISWGSVTTAATTARIAMSAAFSTVAPLAAIAAVGALAMKIKDLGKAGKDFSRNWMEEESTGFDMGNIEQLEEYRDRQRELAEQLLQQGHDMKTSTSFWTRNNSVALNEVANAALEAVHGMEETDAKIARLNAHADAIAAASGQSVDVVKAKIDAMGLGTELTELEANTPKAQAHYESVVASLNGVGRAAMMTGQDMVSLAGDTEELETTQEEAIEVMKAFGEALGAELDVSSIVGGIQEVNDAIRSSFDVNPSEIYGELTQEAEDAAKKASEDAYKSYSEGVDRQIKALQEAKDDLDKPKLGRGKKSNADYAAHDAEVERIEREKKAIDDQIESLREGKREREEFDRAAAGVGVDAFMSRLRETSTEAIDFQNNLQLIRARMKDLDMPVEIKNQIITQLAEMGPEAMPIIQSFAAAAPEEFRTMVTEIGTIMDTLNQNTKVTLDQFIEGQSAAWDDMHEQTNALITLAGQLGGQISVAELQSFYALGPETAGLVPQMVERIQQEGPAGAAKVAEIIRKSLQAADMGEGVFATSITDAMTLAQMAATTKAEQLPEAVRQAIERGGIQSIPMIKAYFRSIGNDAVEALLEPFQPKVDLNLFGAAGSHPARRNRSQRGQRPRMNANADGGFYENHPAKVYSRTDGIRVFNEPETGGEAYIPLGSSKRGSAVPVLSEVARKFGYQLHQYANGGFHGTTAGSQIAGGGAYGPPGGGREAVVVTVPIQKREVTQFNGPIQGVKLEDAERYAARKRRQKRLARG